METARRDYLVTAILIAAMALFVWLDSIPSLRVPVGVATIALAILTWVTPVVRPRPAGTPDLPLSHKIGLSIGLALFGVSRVWVQHDLSTLAILCIFVPQIPQMIRGYRRTDSDSISER